MALTYSFLNLEPVCCSMSGWNLVKLKSLYTAKETINKVRRQLSGWKKIIANETTDKGLISKK